MISIILVMLFASAWGQGKVCRNNQFNCMLSKECIDKKQWCDGHIDCSDDSDEYFCDGRVPCMEGMFQCSNQRCIPLAGLCDGVFQCTDGSDENCRGVTKEITSSDEDQYVLRSPADDGIINGSIANATRYLLNEQSYASGWGGAAATARAIVALAFAERVGSRNDSELSLIKEYLNIQLALDLMPGPDRMNLGHLALYINALYATCQEPRDFQGVDLVARLRSKTDVAMKSRFNLPIVLLTLCIANETKPGDVQMLQTMYIGSKDKIGSQALAVMAMICFKKNRSFGNVDKLLDDFFVRVSKLQGKDSDIYTKALLIQASNAVRLNVQLSGLLRHQLPSGSFGDLMATYYAIPALLKKSLLDLKCERKGHSEAYLESSFSKLSSEANDVTYSLRTTTDAVNTHTIVVPYQRNVSFYEIMKMAALRDSAYRFVCDDTSDGKVVYSLADIPDDAETGRSWTLYWTRSVTPRASEDLQKLTEGVDRIFPHSMGNGHFIFWLRS